MQQVLSQIKPLEQPAQQGTQGIMLQRFVEDTAIYAETVIEDSAVGDLDEERAVPDTQELNSIKYRRTPSPSQEKPSAELLFDAILEENTLEALRLISLGVDVNAVSSKSNLICRFWRINGSTPLIVASDLGRSSVIELLLKRGASVDSRGTDCWTPLMLAAQKGHQYVVRMLLDYGADINESATDQQTALIVAVLSRQRDIIEILIQKGADRNKKYKSISAFDFASCLGY
jgi:ankyrin repeat protein